MFETETVYVRLPVAHGYLTKVITRIKFKDGVEVTEVDPAAA